MKPLPKVYSREQIEREILPTLTPMQHELLWTIGLLEEAKTLGLISDHPCTLGYDARVIIECLRDRKFRVTEEILNHTVPGIYGPKATIDVSGVVTILLGVQDGSALAFLQRQVE